MLFNLILLLPVILRTKYFFDGFFFFFALQKLEICTGVFHRCLALSSRHRQQFWYRTHVYSTRLSCAAEDLMARVTGVTGARLMRPRFIVLKVKFYSIIYRTS